VIPTPTVVTDLDESTESELVRFDDVLVTSISGSNYTLVSGNDTIVMRVDSDTDVDDSLTFVVGDSLCYVIGIGGQFDNSNPYTSGYQMFPRYYTDIDTACGASVTPPAVPTYPIADINNVDVDGVADSLGITCWTKGVVLGVDMDGNAGLSFTIWDGEGINIYNPADVSAYVVTEGDSILVRGTIDQYNGLTELIPDSIQLLNTGNVIPTPTVVTTLSESTESELIRIENVLVAGINPTGGSGTNYDLVMGTDTLTMRVDNDTDVDDSLTFVVGDSLCYIIGIGGQFDGTNPYTSGYQIFPRYYTDIDTTCGGSITPPVTPEYEIADINNVDVDGVADSNGVYCWTEGVVLGVNMRPAGLQFTIWDMEGIGVFNNTGDLGYTVAEGDLIRIKGTVSQFNGLTQMNPDEIVLVSSNNTIPVPEVVSTLSEDTESELVRVNSLMVASIDSSSSAINYALVSGADTITMRVDLDTDVEDNWSLAINDSLCYVIGIGGQFDNSSPYTSGYQLFPRTAADLDTASCIVNSVNVLSAKEGFAVYPNPVSGSELFFNQVADVVVYNTTGSIVMNAKQVNRIAVDQLKAGVYIIRTANAEVVRVVVR
jgi:DNA/RNA endonuclease YhcR with UshA esterase domain